MSSRPHLTITKSLDDLDFTILAAKSIFSDMLDTCPDANMWMEAFELTSKAATKITRLYGDFGKQSQQTDWEEDESNSIMQDLPLNTLDPHMSPRPGTLSYPSPDNLESVRTIFCRALNREANDCSGILQTTANLYALETATSLLWICHYLLCLRSVPLVRTCIQKLETANKRLARNSLIWKRYGS